MIMNKKRLLLMLQPLFISLLMIGSAFVLQSCGDDEEVLIDYYLNVSSKESLGVTSEDESQGTMGQPNSNVLANTIWKMKKALRDIYPEATIQGNDVEVMYCVDKVYSDYKAMYGQLERNTICVVKLFRVKKVDGIIRSSTTLQTYHFGAIPPAQE